MRKYVSLRYKKSLSFLIDKKAARMIFVLLTFTFILFLISAGMGDMKINPIDVFKVFIGQGDAMHQLVVTSFRLPRMIIALLAGICLAVSGAILQGMIRNPLASPDIIGITGGASVAIVTFLTIFSDRSNSLTVSIHWLPLAAFVGATTIALFVYGLAWKKGVSPIRLVLIGIGMSALTQSVTSLLMIIGPIHRANEANVWITGSVYGSNWENVALLSVWTIVLLIVCLISLRNLNMQELGDQLATGLGSAVQRQRFVLLILATALTGGAVAFAGGIGFVGLMAPHMARKMVGAAFGALVPVAALIGGMIVMFADLLGRTLFSPLQVPAGVFTAAIGAPYFIYLLYKYRNI